MKNYCRIMPGRKSIYAKECFEGGFIGADFGIAQDLSNELQGDWRNFSAAVAPMYLSVNPGKHPVTIGLACGAIWRIAKDLKEGDFVLSPDGQGSYRVGEVSGSYYYEAKGVLPHRRPIKWIGSIQRADMSDSLRNSSGSIGTVSDVSGHGEEIQNLLGTIVSPVLMQVDQAIEDLGNFALEKHLEDFLVENWAQTDLAKQYDIYQDDEVYGKQVKTDTGWLDILAVSKDKKEFLVIELKKCQTGDRVVGQVLRYMGYIKEMYATNGETVRGAIIAPEDDRNIKRALSMTNNIDFYRYQVSFKLSKA